MSSPVLESWAAVHKLHWAWCAQNPLLISIMKVLYKDVYWWNKLPGFLTTLRTIATASHSRHWIHCEKAWKLLVSGEYIITSPRFRYSFYRKLRYRKGTSIDCISHCYDLEQVVSLARLNSQFRTNVNTVDSKTERRRRRWWWWWWWWWLLLWYAWKYKSGQYNLELLISGWQTRALDYVQSLLIIWLYKIVNELLKEEIN
jgi:hypothetical protein